MFANGQHHKRRRALDGIAVDTGADRREGDGLEAPLGGQLQRAPVARREQIRLPVLPAVPHRSHGMNDLPSRKAVAAGDSRVAVRTPAQGSAFGEQFRSGGTVDAPSTPPPPRSEELATFTIASTASVVISA